MADKAGELTAEVLVQLAERAAHDPALKDRLAAALASAGISISGNHNQVATTGGIAARDVSHSLVMPGGRFEGNVYFGARTADPDKALAIYRELLVSQHSRVPLRGIQPLCTDGRQQRKMPELAQIYIALNTKAVADPDHLQRKLEQAPPRESKRLSALEAAIHHPHMVLLGDPGSGKSTFVNHLALRLAANALFPEEGWLDKLPGWPREQASLLPLPVILRDFALSPALQQGSASPRQLWDFVLARLASQNLDFAAEPLHLALEQGQVLLILDGMDEIVAEQRGRVRDTVLAFAKRFGRCRIVATCRTLSYQARDWPRLDELPSFELAPFDDEQIDGFIHAWYAELGRLGEVGLDRVPVKAGDLQKAVRRPDIHRLAPNPLLLSVMATFHAHRGTLPDQRARTSPRSTCRTTWRRCTPSKAGTGPSTSSMRYGSARGSSLSEATTCLRFRTGRFRSTWPAPISWASRIAGRKP